MSTNGSSIWVVDSLKPWVKLYKLLAFFLKQYSLHVFPMITNFEKKPMDLDTSSPKTFRHTLWTPDRFFKSPSPDEIPSITKFEKRTTDSDFSLFSNLIGRELERRNTRFPQLQPSRNLNGWISTLEKFNWLNSRRRRIWLDESLRTNTPDWLDFCGAKLWLDEWVIENIGIISNQWFFDIDL